MKVLIIHHVQACWATAMYNFGRCPQEYTDEIVAHLESTEYDRIIVTNFEGTNHLEGHQRVFQEAVPHLPIQVEDYCYGWRIDECFPDEERKARESFDDDGRFVDKYGTLWADGCSHSEIVPLPQWMQDLSVDDVYLLGAFDGECILTISTALWACDVSFNRLNKLIVG